MRGEAITRTGAHRAKITAKQAVSDLQSRREVRGRKMWCALITGSDATYTLKREFCQSTVGYDYEKKIAFYICFLKGPGIYEFRNFRVGDSDEPWSGFFQVWHDDTVNEINAGPNDIKKMVGNIIDRLAALAPELDDWEGPMPPL